jgi:nicotinate-nucleotide adenylyltransferase
MTVTEPIGILGGTFDPVHNAHVALARVAAERLGLARVIWIPAGQPPHRAPPQAAPHHRLAMTQLAAASDPRFCVDDSEVASTAASYTVHTLERLRAQHGPKTPLVLLMGADALAGLASWHRWRELTSLAHIGVATRPGFPFETLAGPVADLFAKQRATGVDFSGWPAGNIVPFELVAGTVSATEARDLLAVGAPREKLLELLPAPVLDYIVQHSLYRD